MRKLSKRPLCLLSLCFVILLWILDILGATREGAPKGDPYFESLQEQEKTCNIQGELYQIDIKENSTYLYLKSVKLICSDQNQSQSNNTIKLKKIRIKESEKGPFDDGDKRIYPGDILHIAGKLYSLEEPGNPGQFNSAAYYRHQGVEGFAEALRINRVGTKAFSIKKILYILKERQKGILLEMLPHEAGILSAMLLGDKSLLQEETKQSYEISGIIHVLAISGTHLHLAGQGLMFLFLKIGLSRKRAGILSLLLLITYGIFTGSGVSTLRAVIMFFLSVGAEAVGRTYDLLTALCLSGILMLSQQPGYLYESSFLLSFTAVLGLSILGPELPRRLAGVSVIVMQLPVVESVFYQIPVFSLLSNLLLLPLLPVALGSGMLGLLVGNISIILGRILIAPAQLVLYLFEAVGNFLKHIPNSIWITGKPALWQIIAFYGILALGILFKKGKWKRWILLIPAAVLLLTIRFPSGFSLTMVDVGQGDCFVVETPTGENYLIDGGSSGVADVGTYRIIPYLKYRGIRVIDGIFISHGDEDHINGIIEILEAVRDKTTGLQVKRMILPRWMKGDRDLDIVKRAEEAGVEIYYGQSGDTIAAGEVNFEIIAPAEEFIPENENSGSMVIRISYRGFKFLLTGDLSDRGEEEAKEQDLSCQVLKVAHHGSSYSTDREFLEKADCRIALISCGKNNRYGHPGEELLDRLAERNIRIFDTRRDGAVTLRIKNNKLTVYTFRE